MSRPIHLALLFTLLLAASPLHAQPLRIGARAPDFTATTLDGDTLRLTDLRGRVVLLDFWATWCAPCLPELPRLRALRARHPDTTFALVSISLDGNRDRLRTFILNEALAWPHVQQTEAFEGDLASRYGVVGIPATFLLSPSGHLVARGLRGLELEAAVDALVASPAGPNEAPY